MSDTLRSKPFLPWSSVSCRMVLESQRLETLRHKRTHSPGAMVHRVQSFLANKMANEKNRHAGGGA